VVYRCGDKIDKLVVGGFAGLQTPAPVILPDESRGNFT